MERDAVDQSITENEVKEESAAEGVEVAIKDSVEVPESDETSESQDSEDISEDSTQDEE